MGWPRQSVSLEPDHAYRQPPERAHVESEERLFREMRGIESTVIRAQAIAALPTHVWHGTRVYGLMCQATFGRRAAHHISTGRVSVVVD